MAARARKKERAAELEQQAPELAAHVAMEDRELVPPVLDLAPNYGAEMLEGIRALSGVLQRGFEDIGDNFNVMRHDMSTSFAELRQGPREDPDLIPPGQGAPGRRPEHEISDNSDICALEGTPSLAGSVTNPENLPKDEFFKRYNDACKKPLSVGPAFPTVLTSFMNGNFENLVGDMKAKELMAKWLRPEGVDWL